MRILLLFILAALRAHAQWQMQPSGTAAGLRGIHSVNGLIAWASGTDGMVLRTEDAGSRWQRCAPVPGGEGLDFRGIWAWDANRAMIMSSGPGDRSRVYQTADGCAHWLEIRRNSEKQGFWDAMVFETQAFGLPGDERTGVLVGDPVAGRFYTEIMSLGHGWVSDDLSCPARADEAAFAASNSSVFVFGAGRYILGTGGKGGSRALLSPLLAHGKPQSSCLISSVPLATGSDSSGVFSVAFRDRKHGIAVGGDYKKPDTTLGTAAWTSDDGLNWAPASRPPHGFRSAVSFYAPAEAWMAVGTNGSDASYDDGKTWEVVDNGSWNALSLPYAVGPQGRIGKLRAGFPKSRRNKASAEMLR